MAASGTVDIYREQTSVGCWGLEKGCAVVWTDKGAGAGVEDLVSETVVRSDGTVVGINEVGTDYRFVASLAPDERKNFLSAYPNRLAFKWAHARFSNEEAGPESLLNAIRFAFWQLNQSFADRKATISHAGLLPASSEYDV